MYAFCYVVNHLIIRLFDEPKCWFFSDLPVYYGYSINRYTKNATSLMYKPLEGTREKRWWCCMVRAVVVDAKGRTFRSTRNKHLVLWQMMIIISVLVNLCCRRCRRRIQTKVDRWFWRWIVILRFCQSMHVFNVKLRFQYTLLHFFNDTIFTNCFARLLWIHFNYVFQKSKKSWNHVINN